MYFPSVPADNLVENRLQRPSFSFEITKRNESGEEVKESELLSHLLRFNLMEGDSGR